MNDTPRQRRTFGAILSDIKSRLEDAQAERDAKLGDLTSITTRIMLLKEILDEAEKPEND